MSLLGYDVYEIKDLTKAELLDTPAQLIYSKQLKRPLHNIPLCPFSMSGSNFNPNNTQCIQSVKILTLRRQGQVGHFEKIFL